MAKDKERSVNPAQQQRKADKARALKKSKADLQARRNEKLAKRNPERIQRQIDDLKALEAAGDLKAREKAILADLERDLKAVHKAREALGDKAPYQPSRPRDRPDAPQSILGKRRHDGQRKHDGRRQESGSDTDESVRNIPWPRDTPPPIPKEFRRGRINEAPHAPVVAEAKTTYESAPQIRDLKKEAVNRFVPNAVKRKQDAVKGHGGQLLEPDELDRLEREGHLGTSRGKGNATTGDVSQQPTAKFTEYHPTGREDLHRLKAEEEAFERELAMEGSNDADGGGEAMESTNHGQRADRLQPSRHVEIEEVIDEDL